MLRMGSRAKVQVEPERIPLVAATVGRHLFGFDLQEVREVLAYRTPARTPRPPRFVEGVVEHKGRLLPVVSLRRRLGLSEGEPGAGAILLLAWEGVSLGIGVDAATQVIRLKVEELTRPSEHVFGIRAEYLRGVAQRDARPILWLATSRLLTSGEPITMVE